MKAIPTLYKGILYRSRLEAKYASFFDQIGWRWTYEPIDGNGYIPDFLIHGDEPVMVEIKPAVTEAEYRAPVTKMVAGLLGHWTHDVLILGADPLPSNASPRTYSGSVGPLDRVRVDVQRRDLVHLPRLLEDWRHHHRRGPPLRASRRRWLPR